MICRNAGPHLSRRALAVGTENREWPQTALHCLRRINFVRIKRTADA